MLIETDIQSCIEDFAEIEVDGQVPTMRVTEMIVVKIADRIREDHNINNKENRVNHVRKEKNATVDREMRSPATEQERARGNT
ncbi:hypothetical protein V6N12_009921 [Hibiscus sabdariffa]|uniref:Uncharacterized protein n=1 Tax=Hibiscus sabdariffa TaxID=183260 RepID=A0ABR2EFR2_9ROSI